MDIKEKAYQKYKLDWICRHGKSLDDLVDCMTKYWKDADEKRTCTPSRAFFYVEEAGFDGELWACFEEFLETEYRDMEYMGCLLNAQEYKEYLMDRTCDHVIYCDHVISEFKHSFYFLSNFYPVPFYYKGVQFLNAEAAFQAQKDPKRQKEFSCLGPSEAKRLGRRVELREDWELVKESEMFDIVQAKFQQNPELAKKLLETGNAVLIEGNQWHDNIWGSCTCDRCKNQGSNKLGRILMAVRHICRVTERMKQDIQKDGVKNNVRN